MVLTDKVAAPFHLLPDGCKHVITEVREENEGDGEEEGEEGRRNTVKSGVNLIDACSF